MSEFDPPPPPPQLLPEVAPAPPKASSGMSDRTFAMLTHLSSLSMFIGVPFGNILGPLILWVIKKDEMPLVDRHGKEAVNFGISMTIYMVVSGVLCLVLIGFVLLPLVLLLALIFPILAGIRANEGGDYEYPMTIRFLK